MSLSLLIMKFFSGLVLLIAIGWLIGHLLGLDDYREPLQKNELNEFSH
jgi:hypothetical protein